MVARIWPAFRSARSLISQARRSASVIFVRSGRRA